MKITTTHYRQLHITCMIVICIIRRYSDLILERDCYGVVYIIEIRLFCIMSYAGLCSCRFYSNDHYAYTSHNCPEAYKKVLYIFNFSGCK